MEKYFNSLSKVVVDALFCYGPSRKNVENVMDKKCMYGIHTISSAKSAWGCETGANIQKVWLFSLHKIIQNINTDGVQIFQTS